MTKDDLQNMLNIVNLGCTKWRLVINQENTQIVNYRKKTKEGRCAEKCTQLLFWYNPIILHCALYIHFGFTLDEHMPFEEYIRSLADSAGRALGSVFNKLKICKDLGYCAYSQL